MIKFSEFLLYFWAIFICLTLNIGSELTSDCIVTEHSQLMNATENCLEIVVRDLTMPGGLTAHFHLKDGATVTFEGTTVFGYIQWPDWGYPLMHFKGNNVTVEGAPGSLFDGRGALYWDGIGDNGAPKPYFIHLQVNNSVFRNINLLNCPHHCTIINGSDGLTLTGWNIDCSYGDEHGGHNTDGFDVVSGNNIVIEDSTVINQDDCVAVNQGFNMSFSGLRCSGSHGLSLSVGFSNTSYYDNTVRNITYSNSTLTHSMTAIHIKTHNDGGPGEITDVTYEDISFTDVTKYAINIQQDYAKGRGTKEPKGNVPITDLKIRNIKGTLSSTSKGSMQVYILCAERACTEWNWSDVEVIGGAQNNSCNYTPDGYVC
ncbi:hypothetical protein NQ318_016042 [Aromia moschata]|uniref:endo-polygalacturonase n=1 Tax=Aromia moschata TaxID=1265417 RepID=A0AAV8Y242_9CUCU|nr:hypothetical protein NQ318_016042 [Aromia moschata]